MAGPFDLGALLQLLGAASSSPRPTLASAERPSAHPNGYWMAGTPASAPAHALPEWWGDIAGAGVGDDTPSWLPPTEEEPLVFPVPNGDNARKKPGSERPSS